MSFAFVLPTLTVLVATVLVLLPWGGGETLQFVAPLLPLMVIHDWGLRRPAALPAVVAFLSGLTIDVVSYGPVGFWALLFLSGLAIARGQHRLGLPGGAFGRWVQAGLMLTAIAGCEWLLGSIYFLRPLEWRPMIVAAVIATAVYPVVMLLLGMVDRPPGRPSAAPFARRT